MPLPPDSSSPSSSSKLVYFVVVIPLILLSGLVLILNHNPSTTFSWPLSFLDALNSHSGARAPAAAAEGPEPAASRAALQPPAAQPTQDQSLVMENVQSAKTAKFGKTYTNLDNLDMVEASLAQARATIQEAQRNNETSYDPDYVPTGPMYRNPNAFLRSYLEMEKLFKIYVYEDGEPPLYHYSKSLGILGIEGILIHQIEISKFRTRDPGKAHVYFIPLSVQSIVAYAYVRHNRAWSPLQNIARDYVKLISTKYPYWNRTLGCDHFILGCHDWTPMISNAVPDLFKNSIRVLCNANTSEGFKPSTDVSLPEIYLPHGTMDGLIGGMPPSERSVLVFYAGGIHGYIRQVLMDQWKDKDPDIQIHEYLPKNMSYYSMFRKSKYCICPSGWEVASPRMVEGLYMGCVPVLLKDHYAKPFNDVLDWSTFSVDVPVNQIPDLKKILTAIPQEQYQEMQKTGILVRRHFEVNFPPKRYDVFHMILHSIWLRRINIQLHDTHES
ncbi:probable glycosyltransferase At5g03795 [Sesamum indicum]|uniref:Probable glycosyltransferase At5g03795 n=1 Tax=Sesamum indicum TaxID=4182 RepID=A0A6I9U5I7_SESIN|nr:probable glycosyltransferase At5g03795 [Sesamum indicum]